jgi:hypothetical protein
MDRSRTIVGLMAFAVVFSLIGNELKHNGQTSNPNPASSNGLSEGGTIVLGGTVATVLLILLSHAGSAGSQFAVGLAGVTLATSALVYGGPVWSSLGKLTGSTSTSIPTVPSAASSPSAPASTGAKTAVATPTAKKG